jgi:TatD DNase family protein
MLTDCHTHLDSYSDDDVPGVLARARDAGVGLVITAGTTLESSRRGVELASRSRELFAGVGVHPMDLTGPIDDGACDGLRRLATSTDKVVVMSEIGLDFMEGMPDRSDQYQAFRAQIALARELRLPIVFHSREAHHETLRVLREERAYEVGGAMHYFQADRDTASKAIDLGFHISLARPLLRLPELQQVAAGLPLDSILLETDAAPQPFKAKRSNWTEPRHTRDVAARLAELHELTPEEVEAATTANLLGMLGERRSVVERYLGLNAATDASSLPPPSAGGR